MKTNRRSALVALFLAVLSVACAGAGPKTSSSALPARGPGAEVKRLTYFSAGMSPERIAELHEAAPNVDIVVVTREEALARAGSAEGADARLCSEGFLAAAPNLRWVQAWSAGVDRYLGLRGLMDNDAIAFANMKGAHGPAISEHVFATLLSLTRRLDRFRDAQREGRWSRDRDGMTTLAGRTLLVVGMGGIGTEVARRGRAFDMRVLATVRTKAEAPDFVDRLETADALDELLPEADVVVLCVPLTDETRGLFDAERFELMRPGAYLVNIARGEVVDTDALIGALDRGHLGGACLDVTDPEPLPEGHPLFGYENVVITPHVAGAGEVTGERRFAIFKENVRRFGAGEPLANLVDKDAGY